MHGINTLEHQPAKVAAMEGHFETHSGAPLILFGMPNEKDERTDYAIEIPRLGSLILTHSLDGKVRGLKEWPADQRPPVAIVFWSFRIMVGIGFAILGLGALSLYHRIFGTLYDAKWLHRLAVVMGPSGFVAVLAGWITTEVGRQPFSVYGLLKTVDSASPIAATAVASSLIAFVVVYFAVFGAGVFYIARLMNRSPHPAEGDLPPDQPIRASGINPAPAMETAGARI